MMIQVSDLAKRKKAMYYMNVAVQPCKIYSAFYEYSQLYLVFLSLLCNKVFVLLPHCLKCYYSNCECQLLLGLDFFFL